MQSEFEVLKQLQKDELTTQREISKNTGLSLGAVNILINKMVRKGLVKIEKINARTMRYILTPRGIQEKARLAYNYIRQSYQQLLRINHTLSELLTSEAENINGQPVILCGPNDEICTIITQHLKEKSQPFKTITTSDALNHTSMADKPLVITWREEEEAMLYFLRKEFIPLIIKRSSKAFESTKR